MVTERRDFITDQYITYVEKQLTTNLSKLDWEFENKEEFRTTEGSIAKVFFGRTSAFGGATVGSFLSHGGGFTPFYLRMIEIDDNKTDVRIIVSGSETTYGDHGNRNGKVADMIKKYCIENYVKESLMTKVKSVFK